MSLGSLRETIGTKLYRQLGRANSHVQKSRPIPVDVLENNEAYLVVFDVPGAETDDLQVRYLDGSVNIRVTRYRDFFEGFDMRFPGRSMVLDGSVDLPTDAVVDAESATARLSDVGTVKIDIPKETHESVAERDPEQITIDD